MAATKTIGFGIVGCGVIADFHAEALRHMRGVRLLACHDTVPQNAARLAAKHRCAPYSDFNRFLAHPGLRVVTIATPSGLHLEPAVAAAKAGKHLLIEKPLEITLGRCDRIIAAADKAGVLLGGIFPSRFSDDLLTLKRALDRGRFGAIAFGSATVKWYRNQAYYDSGAWRGTWELDGGGCLMNQSIHTVDLLQWLLGPVAEIRAMTALRTHRRIEVEDVAIASLRFRSGALGLLLGSTSAYPGLPRKIEVYGAKGGAAYTDASLTRWDMAAATAEDRRLGARCAASETGAAGAADPRAISFVPHQRQFEDFVKALRGKGAIAVDGREARKAVEIIIGVYLAARRASGVRLPLAFKGSPRPARAGR
ncbi:MAG TPA: Gfo/Idh/MocA family oxidoreductase [Planctomycetota bacterium]|jgi:predicted dehydrogenase|nr:Gfo/Idh/MocA family oxidoreductase [Planctomycetota bacterium]OQC22384.1 MAG: Glucose--fructose oxidoreductase precursor [Planctomycetes bacterium ADurb.Bin069]HNR98847.1 Gfo/Idh/MocA family oxidoreductase [Planctomycetota bacterium]HNU26668.1 Gfo/Idh/MocA family oxidoreductase [Planctomycetota bacterium]HOE29167.1 Gfo/Idh/MocA family oxidoreductase [Planctomycetota bacterium]